MIRWQIIAMMAICGSVQDEIKATRISLRGEMAVSEAIQSLSQQAAIVIRGAEKASNRIKLDLQDVEFWPGLDQVLQQSSLRLFPYGSNAAALKLVDAADSGEGSSAIVSYSGPFRLEAIRAESTKDYAHPTVDQTRIVLGIRWEPSVQPIALQQPMDELKAVNELDDVVVEPLNGTSVEEVSVSPESGYAEIVLPFELGEAEHSKIATLSGTMYAVVAKGKEKFAFEDLSESGVGNETRRGQLTVRYEGWEAVDDR
jgi:hypothetical protein